MKPWPKQTAFLLAPHLEVLYGGAAGGGKSEGGLAAFAQYADIPPFKGAVFRRTFRDLALPGALIDRAHEWWDNTEAHWSSRDFSWSFPSGATLQFGYLDRDDDRFKYQSSEFHYIFFDELTQFTELQYTYLFSRLRKLTRVSLQEKYGLDMEIPLRMRAASNPGGVGHEWVKKRFVGTKLKPVHHPQRLYIPATLEDNPSLDQETYEQSLALLDKVTHKQLRYGDWDIDPRGGKFQRHWFLAERDLPRGTRLQTRIRYWDIAATEPKMGVDPDYTVGTLLALDHRNEFWVLDVVRFRGTPSQNENLIAEVARRDGLSTEIWMEQEPGASGKHLIDHFRRNVLFGYAFRGLRTTGSKEVRANPVSSDAEGGNIHIIYDDWNEPWLDELTIWPQGAHDDQVDSLSGAHYVLSRKLRIGDQKQARQRYAYSE